MNHHLYRCRVMHCRLRPKRHRFRYSLFLLAIDLDALPELEKLRLLSVGRSNVFSFREADYLPGVAGARLKDRVQAFCRTHGCELPGDARVALFTLPRMLGYVFNPVSFYFCHFADGRPAGAIAEVTNTFGERKSFFVPPEGKVFHRRQRKDFYVSPYSDTDVAFDFRLAPPGERLRIQIDDYAGTERTLTSTLSGTRERLTDLQLAAALFRHPLLTFRVIYLIHWQALQLWLKRIPWYRKAATPA